MIVAPKTQNEENRLKALKSYSLLDSLPEKDYDDITRIAAEICGTNIALISLIDDHRQWFKSHHGLSATETPRDYAFCAHAIHVPGEPFIINDSRNDIRFHDNPLVTQEPYVIFYAGIPLVDKNQHALGTLCVIDNEPKELTENQLNSLKALANQVINLFELRRNTMLLENTIAQLEEKNMQLKKFATVAAHDLKTPLIGITGLSNLVAQQYSAALDDSGKKMLGMIEEASTQLTKLVDGLLEYSRCDIILRNPKYDFKTTDFFNEIRSMFTYVDNVCIQISTQIEVLHVNKSVLDLLLINLISNSIRYNHKENIEIKIEIEESANHYHFAITDNGDGIPPEKMELVFSLFEVCAKKDRFGVRGNGIGLATVKRIIEKCGGKIQVKSTLEEGSTFTFEIPVV